MHDARRFLCMLHTSGFLLSGFPVLVPLSHSTATPLTGHYCHGNDRQTLLYDLLPYYASSSSEAAS